MLSATIKGMLAHKLRLVLTATSIALGVAFLAGTLMLNDSMQRAFDNVFGSINSGTDVAVRADAGDVKTDNPDDSRPPIPANGRPPAGGARGRCSGGSAGWTAWRRRGGASAGTPSSPGRAASRSSPGARP